MAGYVYLLHFSQPLGEAQSAEQRALNGLPPRQSSYVSHARHYLGFTEELMPRIYAHLHGSGSRLTKVAIERQVGFRLVRAWQGSRSDERRLKNRKEAPRFCPVCRAHPLNPGLEEINI